MGLFNDVFGKVEDFFGGGGGGDNFIGPLVRGGLELFGSERDRRANEEAIRRGDDAAREKARLEAEGNAAAIRRLDEIIRLSGPAGDRLRDVAGADPTDLTPEQSRSLEETRRNTNARLAASSLRGSGRAITASINDVDEATKARFQAVNQQRADDANRQLFAPGAGAITGQANIEASTGRAQGQAAETTNLNAASGRISDAQIRGKALADIASVAFDDLGRKPRARRFNKNADEEV